MLILANQEEGKSFSEIAGVVRRSKNVVYRIICRFKADKTLEPKPRTGRPPMNTKREDRIIVKMSLKDRFDTATSISHGFCKQIGKLIFRKTVSRKLNKEKLVAQFPCHKPSISKKKQMVHYDFAISCGQRNNGIWFTLDLTVRGLLDVKIGNAYLLNAFRKPQFGRGA